MEITVKKWSTFNPRSDVKKSTWFRLENGFLTDPDFWGWTPAEKLSWVFLLCEASKKNGDAFSVNFNWVAEVIGIQERDLKSTIAKLLKLDMIAVHVTSTDRTRDVDGPSTAPTNERNGTERYERTGRGGLSVDGTDSESLPTASAGLPPFIQIWNEHCATLPKVLKSNASRNKKIDARRREHTDEEWVEIVKRVAASKFCSGSNERGWVATFDWIIQPEVPLKIMEGKYDSRAGESPGQFKSVAQRREENLRKLEEKYK